MPEIRCLSLGEARAYFDAIPLPLRPASLTPDYVVADAQRHGALRPVFLAYEEAGAHWLHSLHLTSVPGTSWRDASSPYGYGGPVCDEQSPSFVDAAWGAYTGWMREQSVVVEYIRFHPVLSNERFYGGHVVPNRVVVFVDLSQSDWEADYEPRLRSVLRKAAQQGLRYQEKELAPHINTFGSFYREAMKAMGADSFYHFEDAYFKALADSGLAYLAVCDDPAKPEQGWLAAALMLNGQGITEYHLAATTVAGRRLGASSAVLEGAAHSARASGRRCLFLGGGSSPDPENPLLLFKRSFSRERLNYQTGHTVFLPGAHDELKLAFAAEWQAHPDRPIFYRKV